MDLVFDPDGFDSLLTHVSGLLDKTQACYEQARQFKMNVENSSWEGMSKREFLAFFDLVLQFHAALHQGETSPMFFNHEELEKQVGLVNEFLENFGFFQALAWD